MKQARTRRMTRAAGAGALGVGLVAGFTIVEMIMVVAIIALLTLGVASVFRVTGQTVQAGKRVSNLNAYAAMVEGQIRTDLKNLTRDGFMVIRHRNAGGTAPNFTDENILLAPGDALARRRRVDELIFFAIGDFTSARDPVHPDRQAKSTQARIYLGHGHRKDPTWTGYLDPLRLDDPNAGASTPKFGQPGPNQYASDWTLLRHVLLLSPPKATVSSILPNTLVDPQPVWIGGDPNVAPGEDLDSRIQIDIQPAVSSVFRYLTPLIPRASHPRFSDAYVMRDDGGGAPARPVLASGIVDVCASDLSEIRAILMDAQPFYNRGFDQPFSFNDDLNDPNRPDRANGSFYFVDTNPTLPTSTTRIMHAWMREAFPANSDAGERMRYELRPPNYLGNLGTPDGRVYDKDYRRVDQAMLSASNFVPGCTEFIVEWSFGQAYPAGDPQGRDGQIIWHGLERTGGATPNGNTAYAALPYGDPRLNGFDLYRLPYRKNNGETGYWPPLEGTIAPTFNVNVVRQFSTLGGGSTVEYSYFGYVDPTYRLRAAWTDTNGNGLFDNGEAFEDRNGNGVRDSIDEALIPGADMWYDPNGNNEYPDANEPGTIPWPWPRLLRFTISLADPTDPLREQTFQFVVEVPQGPINVQ